MVLAAPIKTAKASTIARPATKAATMNVLEMHKRVEHVDDERNLGHSIIITLKQGWSVDPLDDARVFGADTIKEALDGVRNAHPFDGPYTT